MKILQLTAHYYPNVGGVETHLHDLVSGLIERGNIITVLTYNPLTTNAKWQLIERERKLLIVRLPWIKGFFYKLVRFPALEFLYLFPGLFIITPFIILGRKIDVIHAHGLVAGAVGVFWSKILNKRIIISTHSIYHFPTNGAYSLFVRWMLVNADHVLCLSLQSKEEIVKLGIPKEKITVFTYWVDQDVFRKISHAKEKVGWEKKFVVLFVGRLVEEKGVKILISAARSFNKNIYVAIAGVGPLQTFVEKAAKSNSHILYLGKLEQSELPLYYSAADVMIIPSIHEEGFGRVILEALSCGVPVVASNRGAIPEAVDTTVAKLITISPKTIIQSVEWLYKNPDNLKKMALLAREFAQKRYSDKNAAVIINTYK